MSTLTKEWLLKTIAEVEEDRDYVPVSVIVDGSLLFCCLNMGFASLEAY
ncbi:hypothetical protein [Enterobacter hormaechei]